MVDRQEFLESIRSVRSSPRVLCSGFQRDLSSLLDGELRENHSQRALAHMERCGSCAEFFEAIRLQALAHRDLAVPGSLARRLRRLRGQDLFEGMTDSELVRRLASALYQLGKAYVLTATRHDYLVQVAELPVEIDSYERGELAEAAQAARHAGACRLPVEVLEARSADHLEKGQGLLSAALQLKPRFTEARLYLGFVNHARGEAKPARQAYRQVFLQTDRLVNRAYAAIQLGMLYHEAGNHRGALRIYRWVLASGLLARRPEFAYVLYNLAVEHFSLGHRAEAAAHLARLRKGHPAVWEKAKEWLRLSPEFLERIKEDPQCRRELESDETAFFAA
ncbi:MAG TPA: hypothetical protein VGC54_13270 [Planctomycetota bacterium]